MANQWVMDEMESVDLRDRRLERRLVQLLDTLSQSSQVFPAKLYDHMSDDLHLAGMGESTRKAYLCAVSIWPTTVKHRQTRSLKPNCEATSCT